MSYRKETKIVTTGDGDVLVLHEGTEFVDLVKTMNNNAVECISGPIEFHIKGDSWSLEIVLIPTGNAYKAQCVMSITEREAID